MLAHLLLALRLDLLAYRRPVAAEIRYPELGGGRAGERKGRDEGQERFLAEAAGPLLEKLRAAAG